MALYPIVEYPRITIEGHAVRVDTLSKQRARRLAPQLYGLIVSAYSPQFEGEGKPLPVGTFAAKYGLDHLDDKARQERSDYFDDRLAKHFERGGSYHAVFHPTQAGRVIGSLKVLPGRRVEKRFIGYYGLAEILVDPDAQGRGVGAAMLHASITVGSHRGEHPPGAAAALDAFNDSPVNKWYESLSFQPEQPSGELRLSEEYALSTTYYVTAPDITLGSIAHTLQERHPQLAVSRVTATSR